jgi:hypothetical protein
LQVLQYGACAIDACARAGETFRSLRIEWSGILNVENWLVHGEELVVGSALSKCCALFVDSEVHDWRQHVHDIQTVLQPDSHIVFCSFCRHPLHVANRVGAEKTEAIVVLLKSVSELLFTLCTLCGFWDGTASRPTYITICRSVQYLFLLCGDASIMIG